MGRPVKVLGLDGGGTKTGAVLMEDGVVLGCGAGGAANPRFAPEPETERAIRHAVRAALGESRADPAAVARLVFGGPVSPQAVGRVARELLPHAAIRRASEGDLALAAAHVSGPGIAVVAGTGSMVMVRTPAGARVTVGGWGSVMGDEGSAYDIARRALRAAAHAEDGWGPPTRLADAIQRWAGAFTFRGVVDMVYRPATTRRDIAALARLVSDEAAAGDGVARSILDRAGRDLALQVEAALARAGDAPPCWPLAYAGGVLEAGGPVLGSLLAALGAHRIGAAPPRMTLAEAAAVLAASDDAFAPTE